MVVRRTRVTQVGASGALAPPTRAIWWRAWWRAGRGRRRWVRAVRFWHSRTHKRVRVGVGLTTSHACGGPPCPAGAPAPSAFQQLRPQLSHLSPAHYGDAQGPAGPWAAGSGGQALPPSGEPWAGGSGGQVLPLLADGVAEGLEALVQVCACVCGGWVAGNIGACTRHAAWHGLLHKSWCACMRHGCVLGRVGRARHKNTPQACHKHTPHRTMGAQARRVREGLVVVGSLLDNVPNLAGLCRWVVCGGLCRRVCVAGPGVLPGCRPVPPLPLGIPCLGAPTSHCWK